MINDNVRFILEEDIIVVKVFEIYEFFIEKILRKILIKVNIYCKFEKI